MKKLALLVFLLLASCSTDSAYGEGGGVLPLPMLLGFEDPGLPDKPLEIRDACFSACATKLAAKHLCVSLDARFGVHEVRIPSPGFSYEGGRRSESLTQAYRNALPKCARNLFDERHAFDSGEIVVVTGKEILMACRQIQPCVPK